MRACSRSSATPTPSSSPSLEQPTSQAPSTSRVSRRVQGPRCPGRAATTERRASAVVAATAASRAPSRAAVVQGAASAAWASTAGAEMARRRWAARQGSSRATQSWYRCVVGVRAGTAAGSRGRAKVAARAARCSCRRRASSRFVAASAAWAWAASVATPISRWPRAQAVEVGAAAARFCSRRPASSSAGRPGRRPTRRGAARPWSSQPGHRALAQRLAVGLVAPAHVALPARDHRGRVPAPHS